MGSQLKKQKKVRGTNGVFGWFLIFFFGGGVFRVFFVAVCLFVGFVGFLFVLVGFFWFCDDS